MGKKAKEALNKMRLATLVEPETLARLEEIKTTYIRQGKKVKAGHIVGEAITKLWQEVVKK